MQNMLLLLEAMIFLNIRKISLEISHNFEGYYMCIRSFSKLRHKVHQQV